MKRVVINGVVIHDEQESTYLHRAILEKPKPTLGKRKKKKKNATIVS